MNKQEFLRQLREGLSGLPQEDIEERLTFYREMIDDRTEDGLSEEDAVHEIGSIEALIPQAVVEIPPEKNEKERKTPKKRLKAWEIVLLVLGSPLWLSLLIAALAVVFSLYLVLWSLIVSLWAVFGALVGSAFGVAAGSIMFLFGGHKVVAVAAFGAAAVCAGLSVFWFFGCKAAAKGAVLLTKLPFKNIVRKKEEA